MQVMTEPSEQGQIRAAPQPRCILCGSEGRHDYLEQRDRLFGAPGTWNLKRCVNDECGLMWLDPMPLVEDIGKAYARYYTHASRAGSGRGGFLKRMLERIKLEYLANKYNYANGSRSFVSRFTGWLMYLFPIRRRGLEGDVRFLKAMPGGKVFDVGCGSGDWLAFMRDLGWQVAGMDFDENAVKVARSRGLDVTCGALEQGNLASGSFDAVTLSHVIEHVPDPVGTLAECLRILKPGGTLVLFTPNALSLGHRIFKQDWRGLEPPRHLNIFSTRSMRPLLELAGFKKITVRPHMAGSVMYESVLLRRGVIGASSGRRKGSAAWMMHLLTFVELCLLKWEASAGDCVAAIAVKE